MVPNHLIEYRVRQLETAVEKLSEGMDTLNEFLVGMKASIKTAAIIMGVVIGVFQTVTVAVLVKAIEG